MGFPPNGLRSREGTPTQYHEKRSHGQSHSHCPKPGAGVAFHAETPNGRGMLGGTQNAMNKWIRKLLLWNSSAACASHSASRSQARSLRNNIRPTVPRSRDTVGAPRLNINPDNGRDRSALLAISARSPCPEKLILVGSERDPKTKHKVLTTFTYDLSRCMFCGLCEDACPVDALELTQDFEMASLLAARRHLGPPDAGRRAAADAVQALVQWPARIDRTALFYFFSPLDHRRRHTHGDAAKRAVLNAVWLIVSLLGVAGLFLLRAPNSCLFRS